MPTWTSDLSPNEAQWANEALNRWNDYRALYQQAFALPGDQWIEQFKQISLPPLLENDLGDLLSLAENGVVQTGFPQYSLVEVELASIDRVEFLMCADIRNMAAHYPDGSALPVDLTSPSMFVDVLVVRDELGSTPWIIVEAYPRNGEAC